MRIRKNMYLLSGGIYGQLGNVWMVTYKGGCMLFDYGNPNAFTTIENNLNYWGYSLQDVTHVFMTHGHDDHAGCSKKLQDAGAKIIVGKEDAYLMEQGYFGEHSPFLNHHMPICIPDECIEKDKEYTIGDVHITAYCMPGHTDGTILYLVEDGEDTILFSGDMFSCDGEKGHIASVWWKGDMSYNSTKLGESFARLWSLKLKPNIVAGGHGNPRIGENANEMIMLAYKDYLLNHR